MHQRLFLICFDLKISARGYGSTVQQGHIQRTVQSRYCTKAAVTVPKLL